MIKTNKPLNLAETKKLVAEQEKVFKSMKEEAGERMESLAAYLKKFSKISAEKASKMTNELKNLDFIQLKDKHIIKITDLLPSDEEDIHKILIGEPVSLDKNEIEKILDIVKKNTK